MEAFFALGSIAPFVGFAAVIIGIIVWVAVKVIHLFPEESRGIVIWTMSTVVIYLVLVGTPFALAIFVPEHRGLLILITLVLNLWCLGLVFLIYKLFRREPNASSL